MVRPQTSTKPHPAIEGLLSPGERVTPELPEGQNDNDQHGRLIRYVITESGVDLGLIQVEAVTRLPGTTPPTATLSIPVRRRNMPPRSPRVIRTVRSSRSSARASPRRASRPYWTA